jgi:ubiquinone biosynthesis protein
VDFGIVGSISREDKRYIAENFLAFFNRDYRRVAEMHIESGWVPADTRVEEFESAIRAVCEPIFGKPLKDISYGHLLLRLFQVARRFNMVVQPQLVLLQKTLLNIEGLGRELYPELDLWQTAKPVLERWFKEEISPAASLKRAQSHLSEWAAHWPEMPMLAHRTLERTAQGRLTLHVHELEALQRELATGHRKTVASVSGGALLISGAILATGGGWLIPGALMGGIGLILMLRAG